jgi:hypothetical protein
MRVRRLFSAVILALAFASTMRAATGPLVPTETARVIRVDTVAEFQAAIPGLLPGDALIVEEGEYRMTHLDIRDISGTAAEWITIQAEGDVVIRAYSTSSNAVEIRNVHYLEFVGFEIWSEVSPSVEIIDGIKIQADSSYIVFDQLYIHHVSGNGISVFADCHHLTLTNSEIAHCHGSGLYWGYPGRDIVHNVLIKRNYIHHCPSDASRTTHYGIQYKGWSYRALIEDNVLHDVGGTQRCGIVVYYGRNPLQGDAPGDVNIVRGNVLWNCRNEGITAMSDALVENNIVFDAEYGINLQTYSDESFAGPNFVENLTVRSNTVFRCSSRCISVSGWGSVGSNVSLTGNAAYQDTPGKTAIGGSTGAAVSSANVHYGTCGLSSGCIAAGGLSDFAGVTPSATVPNLDFYPAAGSALLDRLSVPGEYAATDFNWTARPHNGAADAGAYERTGAGNPGWHIVPGFKEVVAGPGLRLHGAPGDATIRLTWQVTGTLPPTTTWHMDYFTETLTAYTATDPLSVTRSYLLTEHVHNYDWYTVTLHAMVGETSRLSDTVRVMPTDRFAYLPLVRHGD